MSSHDNEWSLGDTIAALAIAVPILFILGTYAAMAGIAGWHWTTSTFWFAWSLAGGTGDDGTQASMARAAWAGVVVGVVTIPLLALTVGYAARSARLAQRSIAQSQLMGQRQTRAYIVAHDVSILFDDPDDFTVPPRIHVKITNTGQTPARQMAMRLAWQNHEPQHLMGMRWEEGYSVWDLGAGQQIIEQINCAYFVEDVLMDHFFGEAVSWVQGVIQYEDVFEKTHRTWFRMKLSGTVVDNVPHIFVEQTQKGNRST